MARTPKPWFWDARKSWMVTIDGTRHTLAQGETTEARKTALKCFHALMAKAGETQRTPKRATARQQGPPVLGALAIAYKEHLEARFARDEVSRYAAPDFLRRISGFVERYGDTPAHELRPHHLTSWLESRKALGATSRHDAVGAVKGLTSWAKRQGLIDADPLADMPKPPKPKRRALVMDGRDAGAVVEALPPGPFRDLFMFLYQTGCRPSEATSMEARHVDLVRGVVVLTEHKTDGTTSKARVIALSPVAADLARQAVEANPVGPIFRNTKGAPWNKDSINCSVRRLRKRTGLGRDFFAYALRHGWATDALAAGEPLALVAEMLGHASPRMLAEVHSHLGEHTDLLTEAAGRVRAKALP